MGQDRETSIYNTNSLCPPSLAPYWLRDRLDLQHFSLGSHEPPPKTASSWSKEFFFTIPDIFWAAPILDRRQQARPAMLTPTSVSLIQNTSSLIPCNWFFFLMCVWYVNSVRVCIQMHVHMYTHAWRLDDYPTCHFAGALSFGFWNEFSSWSRTYQVG